MGAPFFLRSSVARIIAFLVPGRLRATIHGCLRTAFNMATKAKPKRQICGLSASRSARSAAFGPVARTATPAAKLRTWPDLCQENPRSMTIRAAHAKTQWQIFRQAAGTSPLPLQHLRPAPAMQMGALRPHLILRRRMVARRRATPRRQV